MTVLFGHFCVSAHYGFIRSLTTLKYVLKDEGEYLLEAGDWKRSDMFFEYRLKEGEDLRLKVKCCNSCVVSMHSIHCLQGNELFKAGKYSEAAVYYRKGLYYAAFDEAQVVMHERNS